MTGGLTGPLWGYCGGCERWRCGDWGGTAPGAAACPVCGAAPVLIERLEDGRARLLLNLEVAVGPVGERSFLVE